MKRQLPAELSMLFFTSICIFLPDTVHMLVCHHRLRPSAECTVLVGNGSLHLFFRALQRPHAPGRRFWALLLFTGEAGVSLMLTPKQI